MVNIYYFIINRDEGLYAKILNQGLASLLNTARPSNINTDV